MRGLCALQYRRQKRDFCQILRNRSHLSAAVSSWSGRAAHLLPAFAQSDKESSAHLIVGFRVSPNSVRDHSSELRSHLALATKRVADGVEEARIVSVDYPSHHNLRRGRRRLRCRAVRWSYRWLRGKENKKNWQGEHTSLIKLSLFLYIFLT